MRSERKQDQEPLGLGRLVLGCDEELLEDFRQNRGVTGLNILKEAFRPPC